MENTLPRKINDALKNNADQEIAVYNHLVTFFSRYYDNGDFISQRRYKNDIYAIPYAGEEVMLHWANKDQYYTKSSENFSNYAFNLSNGKKVQFRLVEADTPKDNQKDNDSIRLFMLAEYHTKIEIDEDGNEIETDILPIEETDDELILRFEYKLLPKKEKQNTYIDQAVEKLTHFAFQHLSHWQELFNLTPTGNDSKRTFLQKHLQNYTAKNSADYFIHKNLGKFLNQELDFYIKSEMMNLDDIQSSTQFVEIEQNLNLIKVVKTAAQEIITFLAQLENFQKKLWLKKKFVVDCHYLITINYLSPQLIEEVLANTKQLEQWQTLFDFSYQPIDINDFLQANPYLVVDTSLFLPEFKAKVLLEIDNLDEQTDGVLIHSDNFQALNLLQERYKEQVKCIYIDPPYNTEKDRETGKFIYKDNFEHSSWVSLISDRLDSSKNLLKNDGSIFISIDDNEYTTLKLISDNIFGSKNHIATLPRLTSAQRPSQGDYISITHDYLVCYAKNKKYNFNHIIERDIKNIRSDQHGKYLEGDTSPILASSTQGYSAGGDYDIKINGKIYSPVDKNGNRRRWLWTIDRMNAAIDLGIIVETKSTIRVRNYIDKEFAIGINKLIDKDPKLILTTNDLVNAKYANNNGTMELRELYNKDSFDFPKPPNLISVPLKLTVNKNDLILDYFAGTGTTAHAVINLNREDQGKRKYILVEQGDYFNTVLKPRVQKVIYSEKWKSGKPDPENGSLNGVPQIVKVLKLESYEDTLNNLVFRQPEKFNFSEQVKNDYLLNYMLNIESRDSLLNTSDFIKPFDYQLKITLDSAGAYSERKIDLVETFNYLIGLRVEEINDYRENKGIVSIIGKTASGEKTLILWRDCEKVGYEDLNDYLGKQKINPRDSEFSLIYINGDHNVPNILMEDNEETKILKIRSIEREFLSCMFGDK